MKKLIAILLALAVIMSFCSLASCGKTEEKKTPENKNNETTTPGGEETEITEEVLKNSKNNEYVKEKLAAGWDMKIACSAQNDAYFVSTQLNGVFRPNDNLTYGQLIAILTRFVDAKTASMPDVSYAEHWAYKNIMTAAAYGWIQDAASVQSDRIVTRSEVVELVNSIFERCKQ